MHDYLASRPAMARLLRASARRGVEVVAVSHSVADDIRATLPGRVPVRTIYNGVDVERFCPGPGDGAALDRAAGLPEATAETVRVGLVATFATWKGHEVFLDAASRLDAALPARFYVVGGPIYRSTGSQVALDDLKARAQVLGLAGRVGFTGHQADPAGALRSLDVVVHASTRPEPFGRVIVEGMACGRAVVAMDEGGAAELYRDGVDALGCSPRDPAALAAVLGRLIVDPALRDRLGRAGRAAVLDRFDRAGLADSWAAVYDRPLSPSSRMPRKPRPSPVECGSVCLSDPNQRLRISAHAEMDHHRRSGFHRLPRGRAVPRGGRPRRGGRQPEPPRCRSQPGLAPGAGSRRLHQGRHPRRRSDAPDRRRPCRRDAVLHLAAQVAVTTSVADPRADFEINALGTFNVLEAVRLAGAGPAVLYSSTNKVYGNLEHVHVVERDGRYAYENFPTGVDESEPLDFHSPYGCSKGAGDQYVRDYARIYGLKTVVFRQSCIYGTRQFGIEDQGWIAWFCLATLRGQPFTIFGDGKQIRDTLWVDDLINAYEAAIERIDTVSGEVFNVGGGPSNTLSLLELVAMLEAHFGRKLNPPFADWRPGDQRVFVADIGKAERLLGWRPEVSTARGRAPARVDR